MKILVQWARSAESDWEQFDSADWLSLPDKGKPGRAPIDGSRGWINALNVQGVNFYGDSLAIEALAGDGVRVHQINDDRTSWAGQRHARIVDIYPLATDANLGGAINTRMSQVVYGERAYLTKCPDENANTIYRPWDQYTPPANALLRRGVWLADALYQKHVDAQSVRGWREWTAGLDPHELDPSGRVRSQRKMGRYIVPDGTRTYYHLVDPISITAVSAARENGLALTPGATNNQTSTAIGSGGSDEWATATPAGEPNNAAWPTGNYRAQIDVVTANPDVFYGLLTLGAGQGGFARWNTGLTTLLERIVQQEPSFSLTGLFLATTGSVSWTAGAATDRYGFVLAAQRVAGHGSAQITLQLGEADDFTDGPWPAAPTATDQNAVFFGTNT